MATDVTERDAREVAEAARETEWTQPSFGRRRPLLMASNPGRDGGHPLSATIMG